MSKEIKSKIETQGFEIRILSQNHDDYISLTDLAKYKNADEPNLVISNWLSNYSTIDFLATWEELNNPNFNPLEFQGLRNAKGRLFVSPKQWIHKVNAIGIKSKAGRYGGTYAVPDIAFEFMSWLSPEFKLYVIKEFQRLKQSENYSNQIEWNVKRELAKANYSLQTDAIKDFIIPKLTKEQVKFIYANEADLLNVALFGMTAKEFKDNFPDKAKYGNMRDNATIEQNIIMTSLQISNTLMIQQGISQSKRLETLRDMAVKQLETFSKNKAVQRIKAISDKQDNQLID